MKILYFDCPTGISGDMFLASLINLGVDFGPIQKELENLPVDKITIEIGTEIRHSIAGTTFRVKTTEAAHHRTFADIKAIIDGSGLTDGVKAMSTEIFSRIADAEGKVHGIKAEEVHFHEAVTNRILDDMVAALKPRRMEVVGDFADRGGIHTVVTARYDKNRKQRQRLQDAAQRP